MSANVFLSELILEAWYTSSPVISLTLQLQL